MPILPMSWKSAPSSSRLSALRVEAELAADARAAMSVIQRACEDVYSSFASSALASASTVERNVSSRLSKLPAFAIASFAWCAMPGEEAQLALGRLDDLPRRAGDDAADAAGVELERGDGERRSPTVERAVDRAELARLEHGRARRSRASAWRPS